MTKVDGWYNDDPPEHEIREKVEVVPLDEPSMEDYPAVDGFIEADEFGPDMSGELLDPHHMTKIEEPVVFPASRSRCACCASSRS